MTHQYTETEQAILADAAESPGDVWQMLAKNNPDMMRGVDKMLSGGATPEWICNRGPFFEMPVEIQTCFINALHWRQKELNSAV